MDWLNQVERIFDFHEVPDYKKVKLVANKLKGRAFAWWRQLQVQRVRMGKGKVQEWFKMKRQLQKQFLPFKYMQTIFQNLHRKSLQSEALRNQVPASASPWQQSWPTKNDYWQTKKDKGNAAECFPVNAVPGLSKAAITCKHGTSNGNFKCYNCGGQVFEVTSGSQPCSWKENP